MPIGRPNALRPRYPCDRGHITDQGYIDRDGYEVQHRKRWDMYEVDDPHGYGRPPIRYGSNQPGISNAPPLLHTTPNTLQAYPPASMGPVLAPAHGKDRPPASPPNFVEDVYCFECPKSSATLSIPNARIPRSAKLTMSPRKRPRNLPHFYELEEVERIARGQKPFKIECNSEGKLNEIGGGGSKFIKVLRALCIVFLDVSIIKVRDQNVEAYASLCQEIDSEFEYIGHPISDVKFKKAISGCMKGECSHLHKLYTS